MQIINKQATRVRPNPLRFSAQVALFGVLSVLLTACELSGGGAGDESTQKFDDPAPDVLVIDQPAPQWMRCSHDRKLECTSVAVPVDYSNPTGQRINVALARTTNATVSNPRMILVNPGGPGVTGLDFLSSYVAFDPRGQGLSGRIDCNQALLNAGDVYALTSKEMIQTMESRERYANDCVKNHGDYLQHLGSMNVVRDMDEMRKAMGLETLDFLGYSYGTRLAGLYLTEFPNRSGRIVLDASVSPVADEVARLKEGLVVAQQNIDRVLNACPVVSRGCDPQLLASKLHLRMDLLGSASTSLDLGLLLQYLRKITMQPGRDEDYAEALVSYLDTDNITGIADVLDISLNTTANIPTAGQDGPSSAAYTAVLCADDAKRHNLNSYRQVVSQYNAISDVLAEYYIVVAAVCTGWPESIEPARQIATNQAPVSLVIGGPSDSQTPWIYSQQMAAAVGGHLIYSAHEGHSTVFNRKNTCVDQLVVDFFLAGTIPTITSCGATTVADVPSLMPAEFFLPKL